MLKFVTERGVRGRTVGFGLTYENLRLLETGKPIQFERAELHLGDGVFMLARAGKPWNGPA